MWERVTIGLACVVCLAVPSWGAIKQDLLVASANGRQIARLDGQSGSVESIYLITKGERAGNTNSPGLLALEAPVDMTLGPDGLLYVTAESNEVWRMSLDDALPPGTLPSRRVIGPTERFAFADNLSQTNGLHSTGITFAPDGRLLVAGDGFILSFDGETGQRLDDFLQVSMLPQSVTSGPLRSRLEHILYGPDGHLYVTSNAGSGVVRLDGQTGEFIDVFASGGGLTRTRGTLFDGLGDLLVASVDTGEVLRYDGTTGEFMDVFASSPELLRPNRLALGTDGNLYVSDEGSSSILRFDGQTGAFLDVFADEGADLAIGILFVPEPGAGVGIMLLVTMAMARRSRIG